MCVGGGGGCVCVCVFVCGVDSSSSYLSEKGLL